MPLTDSDAQRLMQQGLQLETFVQWLAPEEVDMTGEPETFVHLPQGRRLMTLAWEGQGCVFLSGDSCSTHADRPLSCRLYPFAPVLGRRGGIHRLRMLDLTDCEHSLGRPAKAQQVARLTEWHRAELAAYVLKVSSFNRRQAHRQRLGKPRLNSEQFFEHLRLRRANSDASGAAMAGFELGTL